MLVITLLWMFIVLDHPSTQLSFLEFVSLLFGNQSSHLPCSYQLFGMPREQLCLGVGTVAIPRPVSRERPMPQGMRKH